MTSDSTRQRIKDFLAHRLSGREIGDDVDVFETGYVNSLFAVQLVAFVEKEFELTLGPDDLEFDNFRTVAAIARLVKSKAVPTR